MAVQKLSEKTYPAVAEDEPSIMSTDEFYKLRNKSFSMEEIASIRVVFKGKWYRSADYLAREKAASLGANGLLPVESIGREDIGFGASMTYRAFRFTDTFGRPFYTKPDSEAPSAKPPEASSGSPFIAPKPAAAASVAPPAPPRKHRHFDWVWTKDSSVLSHRLGFDTASASKDELEQLKLYVRENFSAAEYKKLDKASEKRSKVMLEFVKRTLE
ncbi:MAG: hypothetical protein M0D55_07345 [Elusimicrobiota bacterium]|nr:MAG: hypothetical protein M0D55_07345 [Elusimicrobiota bacterium]